ncbi:hypothetical protein IWX84_000171 [Flavobacterium sp. CG_9.10]|uniref:hypothetical protein n=1 Tax=Flavobacterium sp. CG_9.10 TaxID=2787729 RepID=UPI0018CA5BA0|nr:hypothetical protein [Flavobacterium sp. CG_9.10]MBG6109316.1 hypothetical protein [Flavobacterium sp. CG_9.10]
MIGFVKDDVYWFWFCSRDGPEVSGGILLHCPDSSGQFKRPIVQQEIASNNY